MPNHSFNILITPKPIAYITFVAAEICILSFALKFLSAVITYMLIQYWVFNFPFFLAFFRTVGLWSTLYWLFIYSLSAVFADLSYRFFFCLLIVLPVSI